MTHSPTDAPAVPAELAAIASRAGLSRTLPPSMDQVDARRTELWTVMFVALVGVGLIIALVTAGGEGSSIGSSIASLPGFRFGLVMVLAGFGGYVFEKERHLRRLARMLVDHHVAGEKQAERLVLLTEVDRIKSELVDDVERDVGAALRSVRDTVGMLEPTDDTQSRILHIVLREVDHAHDVLRQQVERHDRAVLERSRPPVEPEVLGSAQG